MMEEIDRFQVPAVRAEMQPLDPAAAAISDRDCDTREGETVAMNYKPSPLQVKLVFNPKAFQYLAAAKP